MHESPLPIESAFQEDGVQVGVPPNEVSRRGVGDHRSAVDPPARCGAVDVLHHAVAQPADIADQAMTVAEEYAEHLGESEDDVTVREAQQEPLVHVLAEQQGALLRA